MLNRSIDSNGVLFVVNYNGHDLHFNEWSATDDCIYYFPLATLVDNGYAKASSQGCMVPFENIYLLDDDDKMLLGVPDSYDKAMRLRGDGMLNTSDFKYKIEFLTSVPDGEIFVYKRSGNIIICQDKQYLLSEAQYELLRKVEDYNCQEDEIKTTDFNLRSFAEIKKLALQAGCELDSYLANENVYVPDKIKIEVGADEEGFTIDPSIDIEENDKFKRTFDRMRKVQGQYPLQRDNGERVRVVLNPEQRANLEQLKQTGGRHRTREQIKELTEHPTELFDPNVFDLSELYSDRVIEIGIYKPKFYPFICPYKSCWIAGATVETPENGTTKINIGNEFELAELKQCIKDAEDGNKDLVDYKDTQMGIEDAKFLANTAEKQLKSPDKPVKTDDSVHKVLIIEENADEVGFAENDRVIEREDKYTLFKNPFLKESFKLKEHQKEGVAWLQHLYNSKASGCLMADDMGLGKTLQILYFIDWHSRKYPNHKPYLIVAPISLLENWENEYNRFFQEPHLSICRMTSKEVSRHFNKQTVDNMQKLDIILTNYESLRIAQLNFCAVEFDVVALDEAQKIKTPGTLVTNAAKALKSNFKIAMTGTPVENSLLDLWCIMDFCVPGLLGNAKAFAAKYQNPLKKEDTDIEQLGNEVHEKLGIYFMRRLKKDAVKDLPEKYELKQQVEMPSVQENTYRNVINSYVSGQQPNMLLTIMDIREVSEHPYLYDSTLQQHESNELVETSARLQATIPILDRIKDKGEKVIIFSERKETQKMLQRICHERYGIIPKIINGDTPSIVTRQRAGKQSRQASIDDFQSVPGFNVIIMSPVAAGMGLNVTAANHVIHYSRHWNPAKESQATDRAYRIGQTKDVYVYYPMATCKSFKSFDESLDELLSRKTSLATSTIFPTERVEVKQEELGQMLFGVN
ncbi:Superfamily II DNA or RNA helicase, SNF2 family [Segatella bryantii]|uniref:DEAD/DEAH box helicase n=1 Tax=Segatella bryantii TaxID=77095 RepID=UPI000894A8AA|nr:DEAD/DEAH box helicase [Segatella bryantii]SEA08904.1 Superfamily II DNA or RNA helicase, SNF2 family [Segatella bryantii]